MDIDLNRFRGCLLGLAGGDAVGTTVEFRSRGTFPKITDMTGGGPFKLKPGQWTDDTSMALCLAASLISRNGFDPADQMDRYWDWYQNGTLSSTGECFDIGNTVRYALNRYKRTGEPFSGSTDKIAECPEPPGSGRPDVYSIEILAGLARSASERLARLGYATVRVRTGDGYRGWPEAAPFDAIIVTAAPDHVPQPLIDELAPGGRLVIPVGDYYQELMVITRDRDGRIEEKAEIPVRFVPMAGEAQRPRP